MSMLAEPRRKRKKWSKDPRNLNWKNDSSRFSVKLMEKMGWTEGKGLGANLDGRSDNIKIDLRPRQLGLGSSNDYGDTWLAHQDGFEAVLLSLQGAGSEEKKETKPVKSLEETSSKQSKLHYAKFTRGKDLSCASENDLKSIFGSTPGTFEPVVIKQESIKQEKVEEEEEEEPKCVKKKSKKKRKKQQEEEEVEVKQEEAEEEEEVREEPFKTSTISVADYFKSKMYLKKLAAVNSGTYMQCMAEMKAAEQPAVVEPISVKIEPVDDDYEEQAPCKKKKKKSKKTICESGVAVKQEPVDEDATTNGEADKKKKKKKKKTSSTEETTDEKEVETEEKSEKKSKKKRKIDEEVEEETTNSDEEVKKSEKKKKKSAKKEEVETQKKRKTEDEDDGSTTVKKSKKNKKKNIDDEVEVAAVEKKKKKKKKSTS